MPEPTSPQASHSAYIKALLSISATIYGRLSRLPFDGVGTITEQDYHAVLRALTRAYRHRAALYSRTAPASSEQAGAVGARAGAGETPASYHQPAPGKAGH